MHILAEGITKLFDSPAAFLAPWTGVINVYDFCGYLYNLLTRISVQVIWTPGRYDILIKPRADVEQPGNGLIQLSGSQSHQMVSRCIGY